MSRRGHGPGRSERVYRALLLVYPKDFRRRYGPQMVQVFGDLWREERERDGLVGLALLRARAVLDLLRTAASERTRTAPGATFVLPVAGSPRMARWGAAAAIVGVICSLVAPALTVLFVAYPEEPIFNTLWAYQDGDSGFSPFIVLLHPNRRRVSGYPGRAALRDGVYPPVRASLPALRPSPVGVLMCVGSGMIAVYAASTAYRIPLIFDGRLGLHGTSPTVIVADLAGA